VFQKSSDKVCDTTQKSAHRRNCRRIVSADSAPVIALQKVYLNFGQRGRKYPASDKPETGFGGAVAPVCYERFGFLQNLCDTTQKSARRRSCGRIVSADSAPVCAERFRFLQDLCDTGEK